MSSLRRFGESQPLDFESFSNIVRPSLFLLERAVRGQMIVPEFQSFSGDMQRIYQRTLEYRGGKVASYIPQLGRVNPEQYGGAPSREKNVVMSSDSIAAL
jgi:glutaminase